MTNTGSLDIRQPKSINIFIILSYYCVIFPKEFTKTEKILFGNYDPDEIVQVYYKQLQTTKSTLIALGEQDDHRR